jgi:uncharacterized protein DUF6644
MLGFFTWLEDLPLSTAIAGSSELYGFALVLVLHTIGIALTAGPAAVMSLRLLGVGKPFPLASLRSLFTCFWIGFIGNVITGTLLFMMAATRTGYNRMYYAKLVCLFFGVLMLRRLQVAIESDSERPGRTVPSRITVAAVLCLVFWAGVITTGRLIAYTK